eukprot:TRINITY_DN92475_c0_g1_i1.p1 TRINITY_DN92475_c0_g1~~TRINITY_DN92475_c0_g1_i1.p1  ORF type:complete len:206 (+),score=48.53 TRINITY_DN92475_c0_g1_i1:128-745(+)
MAATMSLEAQASMQSGISWDRSNVHHSKLAGRSQEHVEEEEVPLLTAEEEMQYQRALWVNRLLKEQLAAQTQGLSIREIEEAQAALQAQMKEALRLQSAAAAIAPADGGAMRSARGRPPSRSLILAAGSAALSSSTVVPQAGVRAPARTAHSAINRRRRDERIRDENSAFLRRLETVKSTFTPRVAPADNIPRLPARSRLLQSQH